MPTWSPAPAALAPFRAPPFHCGSVNHSIWEEYVLPPKFYSLLRFIPAPTPYHSMQLLGSRSLSWSNAILGHGFSNGLLCAGPRTHPPPKPDDCLPDRRPPAFSSAGLHGPGDLHF